MTQKQEGIIHIFVSLLVVFAAFNNMNAAVALAIIYLVGYGLYLCYFKKEKKPENILAWLEKDKNRNKERIISRLKAGKNITNNEVEKLLNVSDATATRYLNELEREGKVIQKGKTGRFVNYVLAG